MRYELILFELDHRGIANTHRTLKETNDPKEIEPLEAYAKAYYENSDPAKDFQRGTFYLEFVMFEDQDIPVFEYRRQIKEQIEW